MKTRKAVRHNSDLLVCKDGDRNCLQQRAAFLVECIETCATGITRQDGSHDKNTTEDG